MRSAGVLSLNKFRYLCYLCVLLDLYNQISIYLPTSPQDIFIQEIISGHYC